MKLPLLFHRVGVAVARNPLLGFDPIYYRYWYSDTAAFAAVPLVHYLGFGWKEGRDPSAGFSTKGYLAAGHAHQTRRRLESCGGAAFVRREYTADKLMDQLAPFMLDLHRSSLI